MGKNSHQCHLVYVIEKLKNKIRVYFGVSSAETNGLMLLIPMVIVILFIPKILREVLENRHLIDDEEDARILQEWLADAKSKIVVRKTDFVPAPFDPNQITLGEWVALGFKEKIAKRIINYTKKGGHFKNEKDLLKIYGINQNLVAEYKDYIIWPTPKKKKIRKPSLTKAPYELPVPEKNRVKIDLNQADSLQLQSVRGIGRVLSARIIKYREALGGFYSTDQLKEVYGIKDDVYKRTLKYFKLRNRLVKTISINQDSIKTLAKHPYLSFSVSRAIIKYRLQHGDYQSIDELKKIYLINDSLFQKIAPYLDAASPE